MGNRKSSSKRKLTLKRRSKLLLSLVEKSISKTLKKLLILLEITHQISTP
jgi:hypothetical protein